MLKNNIDLNNKTVLVTGAAGFIGCNLVLELFRSFSGIHVVGFDNVNDYYDVSIKEFRLEQIEKNIYSENGNKWSFIKGNIADKDLINKTFNEYVSKGSHDCRQDRSADKKRRHQLRAQCPERAETLLFQH